ncbi:hypothetical protein ACFV0W_30920 [Streptomyces anulatus]
MMIQGVLFDFSGTLFRIEPVRDWRGAAHPGVGGERPPPGGGY